MNLVAYFDESGTHEDSGIVAVGGFISTAPRWGEFCAQWQVALSEFGLGYFHMADFANRVSPYNTWTEEQRRDRLLRFLTIIKANVIGSIGISFQKTAFDLLFSRRTKATCGGAYGLASSACFMDMGNLLSGLNIGGGVDYVFESGAQGASQMNRTFLANINDPEQRERLHLSSLRFENKRDCLPLQSADVLAYELYKQLPKTFKLKTGSPRYPLVFLRDIPKRWGFLDGRELQKFSGILSIRAALEDSGELDPL